MRRAGPRRTPATIRRVALLLLLPGRIALPDHAEVSTVKRLLGTIPLLAALALGCASSSDEYRVGASVTSQTFDAGTADVGLFYDDLSPYGHWFTYGSYGWCWSPYETRFGWRPYSEGNWAYTDAGWTWMSSEPFGWATYHYGRWIFDDETGWVWIPDTEWSPAWVAWRESGDWIGWAPLPPGATWDASAGLSWNDEFANQIDESAWCFVPANAILDASLGTRILPAPRNRTLLATTQLSVHFDVADRRPRNVGLDEQVVTRAIGHPVPRFRVTDANLPGPARRQGQVLPMFRPHLRNRTDAAPPSSVIDRQATSVDDAQRKARQRNADQQRLDADFQSERRRMQAQQRTEEQRNARDPAVEALRQQHAAEMRALDEQHERDRRVIDARYQKGMVRTDNGRGRGRREHQ